MFQQSIKRSLQETQHSQIHVHVHVQPWFDQDECKNTSKLHTEILLCFINYMIREKYYCIKLNRKYRRREIL